MLKRKDNETLRLEITLWFESKGIPVRRYESLQPGEKEALRNLVCIPTHPTTFHQRKDLYTKLCLSDIAGRDSIDPANFMPDEELQKFFTPLTISGTLSYLERF